MVTVKPMSCYHGGNRGTERGTELYLEMEDPRVAILETLPRGDHPVQESGVQREGGSSCKKPAVSWEEARVSD